MNQDKIQELVNAYFTNMEKMNAQGWMEIFSPDALIYDPVGKPPSKPHEDSEKFFAMISNFFEKMELSQDNIFILENNVAVKWTMKVLAKNKKTAMAEGISIFEINNNNLKIDKVSSYWDETAMMSQLKD